MYGSKPKFLGQYKIDFNESCFYLYMPIKLMDDSRDISRWVIPARLLPFLPLINRVVSEMKSKGIYHSYAIYLTVKHGIITPGNPGNRPGWHSDGFMTNDINYVWYDKNPTIFNHSAFKLTMDENISMQEMEQQADPACDFIYPEHSFLRLSQYNIHRVNIPETPMMRTFVKISVSKDKYNLIGNTHNHLLKYNWEMKPRSEQRNVPQSK